MADALNRRIHHDTIDPTAPTIAAARGQRVALGDLIISRRNDPTIPVLDATRNEPAADPVRNGNRWRVYAIHPPNAPRAPPRAQGHPLRVLRHRPPKHPHPPPPSR